MTATTTTEGTAHPEFFCCITLELMEEPVIAADGFSYERVAIEKWFATGHRTSPRTGLPLDSLDVLPNVTLKKLMVEWREKRIAVPVCSLHHQSSSASSSLLQVVSSTAGANSTDSGTAETVDPATAVQRRKEVLAECEVLARQIAETQEQSRALDAAIEEAQEAQQSRNKQLQTLCSERSTHRLVQELQPLIDASPRQALAVLNARMPFMPATGAAELLALRGLLLLKLGRQDEALQALDASMEIVKDGVCQRHPDTLSNKGICLHTLGRLDEALACFEEAALMKPCSEILSNIGCIQLQLGCLPQAVAALDKALASDRANPAAWRNKGDALRRLGDGEEALACYAESLRLRPDDRRTLAAHHKLLAELRKKHRCATQ